MGFLTVTIAIIATSILVLWGLRGTAAEVTAASVPNAEGSSSSKQIGSMLEMWQDGDRSGNAQTGTLLSGAHIQNARSLDPAFPSTRCLPILSARILPCQASCWLVSSR